MWLQTIQIYRSLTLCPGMVPKYGDISMFTRTTPKFLGGEWFGSVSIQSEDDVDSEYYEQLRLLFRCNMVGEHDERLSKDLCLICLYEHVQFDRLLNSNELKWRGNNDGSYPVVEIGSILKAFQRDDHFFVNAYNFTTIYSFCTFVLNHTIVGMTKIKNDYSISNYIFIMHHCIQRTL